MHTKRGFTLVEMLVTIAVSSILLVTVGMMMISTQGFWQKATTSAGLQDDSRYARTKLEWEIRNATGPFVVSADSKTLSFYPVGSVAQKRILCEVTNSVNYLVLKQGAATEKLIPNVTNATFFFPPASSAGTVRINIVQTKKANYSTGELAVSSSPFLVKCRNLD